jgi:hypothetical protein
MPIPRLAGKRLSMPAGPRRRAPNDLLASLAGAIAGAAAGIALCAGAPGVGAVASHDPPRSDRATPRAGVAVERGAAPVAAAFSPARRGASSFFREEGGSP